MLTIDSEKSQEETAAKLTAWPRCPQAAQFFQDLFTQFATANPTVGDLAVKMHDHAGVDILTLVDHWAVPADSTFQATLTEIGLTATKGDDGAEVWEHKEARLPRVRIVSGLARPRLAIAVEEIDDFLKAHSFQVSERNGDLDSAYEEARIQLSDGDLVVVARRGYRGFEPGVVSTQLATDLAEARAAFDNRERKGDETEIAPLALQVFAKIAAKIGTGRAVDEFFAAERRYYMTRNAAARWQYNRQQDLGLGWANHDHHTYRSSRAGFRQLMALWNGMGFNDRERFYAGAEAGWGAQVWEHPVSRVVIFSDVDMLPAELDIDYNTTDLPPLPALGTIGLWCALHGSAIGEAGMHHVEAEFDFAYTTNLLKSSGHPTMKPFTDLPILKQAFTEPEYWIVSQERLTELITAGHITAEDAARFAFTGAPGSHLEVLQRWEGFKGFNKTGISSIILETDARTLETSGRAA